MRFSSYLSDKLPIVVASLLCSGFTTFLLYAVDANLFFAMFVPSVFIASCSVALIIDFVNKRHYYRDLDDAINQLGLEEKRFLMEVIERPTTLEGRIWYDALQAATWSMNGAVAQRDATAKSNREYAELWVHEVKTPLAGMKLTLENSKNKELLFELDKIERLIDQALYFARSGSLEADYLIRQVKLSEIVNSALRDNARYLIQRKVSVELGKLSAKVLADPKWVLFILQQLIDNSVKYGSKKLKFDCFRRNRHVTLTMTDDGVGIPPEDLGRVFDKGFTGANGRRFGKSTGLGLYLCHLLCKKLGLELALDSKLGQGTTVKLAFPVKT
jgi:signal transduction histidine kinase